VNLPKLLSIKHPDGEEEWSAMDICDAFALKRGFLTAKAARPDSYRAANSILRMALDGKITLSLKPVGFNKNKAFWSAHEELDKVKAVQAMIRLELKEDEDAAFSESDTEFKRPSDYQMKEKHRTDTIESKGGEGDDEDTLSENDSGAGVSNPFDLLGDDDD
jgi:hypothetical protein